MRCQKQLPEQFREGVRGKDLILTRPNSKVKMSTITTNEELVIAQDTMSIIAAKKQKNCQIN